MFDGLERLERVVSIWSRFSVFLLLITCGPTTELVAHFFMGGGGGDVVDFGRATHKKKAFEGRGASPKTQRNNGGLSKILR